MQTIILEPHFDDAAYSMTGLLLSGVVPADALIVTVFTRSQFAPYATASGLEQISALRYEEHEKFCERMAMNHCSLGYDEAPQRGWSMDDIFDNRYGNDTEPDLKQQIMYDLVSLDEGYMPDAVFAPLGICGHTDHLLVRECAEAVFPLKMSYYEDLPYAGEIPFVEYADWIIKLTKGLHPQTNRNIATLPARIELLKLYTSQVAEKDIRSVRNYIGMHQGERFWSKTTRNG
jgi:LmbE family N-acetylglucosaminyl deacetylase